MTTRVRVVIAASIFEMSMFSVLESTSTNTGFSPSRVIAETVEKNV